MNAPEQLREAFAEALLDLVTDPKSRLPEDAPFWPKCVRVGLQISSDLHALRCYERVCRNLDINADRAHALRQFFFYE